MLKALGYEAVDFPEVSQLLKEYPLLFNTVPEPPFPYDGPWVAVDLASDPGMRGDSVITARGLPGKYAPESSGRLIAKTILRYQKEGIL
jgi:hypothetical protein